MRNWTGRSSGVKVKRLPSSAASAIGEHALDEALRIERLEIEARRMVGLLVEGPSGSVLRKHLVGEVSMMRRDGEIKAYIDLFFLAAIVLLCVGKLVTG